MALYSKCHVLLVCTINAYSLSVEEEVRESDFARVNLILSP